MSRTAMVIVAGLVVAGSVVAMLPAQESSRRPSKFRTGAEPIPLPTEPAPLLPAEIPAEPAPIVTPNSIVTPHAVPAEAAMSQPGGREFMPTTMPPPAVAPAESAYLPPQPLPTALQTGAQPAPLPTEPAPIQNEAPPVTAPPSAEQPAPFDDSQTRSVLKKARPPIIEQTAAGPPAAAPVAIPVAVPAAIPTPAPASMPPPRMNALPGGSSRRTPATPQASATTNSITARASIQDLAVSGRSAALRVDVAGPQGLAVGKPAAYVINLSNDSDIPADDVLLRVALPGFVSVKGGQPSRGEIALQPDAQGQSRLVWNIPQVAARGREQLKLALVAAEGETFDLGVEWTCKPAAVRASIAVKQPQLELSLAGPADMTFGEEKTFTLTVSNPGTGDAERVVVSISSGGATPQQIDVGLLPAGTKKDLPVAVVASQAGEMELRVTAAGEGGCQAQTTGKIVVRKAEVSVAMSGPPLKYAGTEAIYAVTVSNTGTAPADNVNLSLALPAGAKYLGGIDGAAAAGGGLRWKIASLAAGTERAYEVRVQLATAGVNRLVLQGQSAGGNVSAEAQTEVEAVSDLKLVVNDPSGPLPLGEQAIYEVQVLNRGSQAAQRVKIVMQFSDGIEPISFEGCDARLVPGQVLCQPLPQLGAGEQVTLRVRAKGQKIGTHQFRIEVTSTDGDARLVSEGSTRFFSEAGRGGAAAATASKPVEPGRIQR